MEDLDLACSALLAYVDAVLRAEGTSSRSVNSIEDALSEDVLLVMAGTAQIQHMRQHNLQVLKIVYHRLILENEQAYRLPCPALDALAAPQPPPAEFVKLYSIILLRQAVWSEENSRYVRLIQGLDQKYQECLKEVIEKALTSIPESSVEESFDVNKGDDCGLRRAELTYRIQKHAFRSQEEHKVRPSLGMNEEPDPIETETPLQLQTPSKRNRSKRASVHRPGSPTRNGPTSEDATITATPGNGEAVPPWTPRSQRLTANERIQELQIERLQADLNDKAEELRDLEAQLDESRRNEQAYAHRIAELEEAVEELDRLRDEAEINRHVTEKLRKSETMADKLKKKLEAVDDMRSEMQALESQVQALQDENAVWESKYAELFRSQEMRSGPLLLSPTAEDVDAETPAPVTTGGSTFQDLESQIQALQDENAAWESKYTELLRVQDLALDPPPAVSSHDVDAKKAAQLAEYSVFVHQVEVALQAKDAEIAQLRGTVSGREPGAIDPSGTSTSEEEGTSAQMVSSSGAAQPSGATEEAASESLKTQASLLRRIEELEALLAKATAPSSTDATFPPIRLSTDGRPEWESPQSDGDIANLERDIIKLRVQDALAETDLRRRAEKLSMLKAWTDLSQRALTSTGDHERTSPSIADGTVGTSPGEGVTAERPPMLSWASRIRRHMHSMSQ